MRAGVAKLTPARCALARETSNVYSRHIRSADLALTMRPRLTLIWRIQPFALAMITLASLVCT
jgi:hypothetical protein